MLYYQSLKKIRKEKKVTGTELAKLLNKTRETISAWERGIYQPCDADIRIMAQLLDVSVSDISDLQEIKIKSNNIDNQAIPDLDINGMDSVAAVKLKKLHEACLDLRVTNTRLRSNLFKYEILLQSLPFIIYVKDRKLKYTYVNERFLNLIERSYSKNSMSGVSSFDIFGMKEYSQILELEQKVLQTKQKIYTQQICIPGTFKKKIGLLTIIPILNDNKEVEELVSSIEDITDTYEEERRRKDLEAVVNKINHMIWVGETVDGSLAAFKYIFISDNVSDILGFAKEEFFKDNELWLKLLQDKQVVAEFLKLDNLPQKIEYKINHPQKGVRWISDEIFKEGKSKYYGIVTDITEEKERGHEKEAILRTLDAATDAIKIARIENDKKEYIYINKANKTLYKLPVSKIKNNPELWKEYVHPEDKEKLTLIDKEKQEGHLRLNYKLLFPDGETKYIEENIFREIIDGVLYSGTIKRDVTEERKIEEEIKLFANTMNNIDSCILITTNTESSETEINDKFKMLFVSDGFEKIFAASKQFILKDSRYIKHFIHPNDFKRVDKCWKTRCDKGLKGEISMKYRIVDANGIEKLISDYAKPIGVINGNPIRFGIITDITNERQK